MREARALPALKWLPPLPVHHPVCMPTGPLLVSFLVAYSCYRPPEHCRHGLGHRLLKEGLVVGCVCACSVPWVVPAPRVRLLPF